MKIVSHHEQNHLCFYGAASDQYNNARNLYTCHSLRTLPSPSGLIISYKVDHIHLWHKQYSFITTHSLGFNKWCVSCFQTALNCSVSPSISVRVFRRSTPLCRSVELHWVRTRKGFRISLSTAWLVRLHTHTSLSTPLSKHQTCWFPQHHHVLCFQGKIGWLWFLKENWK